MKDTKFLAILLIAVISIPLLARGGNPGEAGKPFDELRQQKYVPDPNVTESYWVQGTLRNRGKDKILVSKIALTPEHLGTFDMLDIEDIMIEPNSIKNFKINLDTGAYHKIDLYTDDICEGTTVWHDLVGHETPMDANMG